MSTKKRRRLLKRQAHFYNKPPRFKEASRIPLPSPGRRGEPLCSLRNNSSRVLKARAARLSGVRGRAGPSLRDAIGMTSADARMTEHPPVVVEISQLCASENRVAHSARHNYASPRAPARTIVETMSDIIRRTPANPRCRSIIISRDG